MEIDNDELAGRRDIAERLSATPPTPPSLDELQQRRGIAELLSATPPTPPSLDELQQRRGIAELLSATPRPWTSLDERLPNLASNSIPKHNNVPKAKKWGNCAWDGIHG